MLSITPTPSLPPYLSLYLSISLFLLKLLHFFASNILGNLLTPNAKAIFNTFTSYPSSLSLSILSLYIYLYLLSIYISILSLAFSRLSICILSLPLLAPILSTLIVLFCLIQSTFLYPLCSYYSDTLLLILTYHINLYMIYLLCPTPFFSTFLHSYPICSFPSALSDLICVVIYCQLIPD